MNRQSVLNNEKGAALVTALLVVSLLTVIGLSASNTSLTETKIVGNEKRNNIAFYNAEGGLEHAKGQVQAELDNAGSALRTAIDNPLTSYPIEYSNYVSSGSEYSVKLTLFDPSSSPYLFRMESTGIAVDAGGVAVDGTNVVIEARFKRKKKSAFTKAAFGNNQVDLKCGGKVYSYDSDTNPNPNAADYPAADTHEGDVGSNGEVSVKNNTYVGGDVILGEDASGNDATLTQTGTPDIQGEVQYTEHEDPDPLGIVGGDYAAKISYYSTNHPDNDDLSKVSSILGGTTISLNNGDTMTITGPANIYATSVVLNNGATLNVDASLGEVNIWLDGGLEAKMGSNFNVTGVPTDFAIFSNSTSSIIFKHNAEFRGAVYAPYATVEMKNGAHVFGSILAATVNIKHSGELFYDTALADAYEVDSANLAALSWRVVEN